MSDKRAYGIFISRFQKTWEPQPHQDYVVIKCTDGLDKDPRYDEFLGIARDAGLLVGALHYQRTAFDWKTQRDTFMKESKDADFLANDFEGTGNNPSKDFALEAGLLTTSIKAYSGKRTLFYSSPKYIQEWMYPYGIYWVRFYTDLWVAQWPFSTWNARLLEVPDLLGGWQPRLPAGCSSWSAWQYGAEYLARGKYEGVGSQHVCLEVFNGTIEKMKEWAGCLDEDEDPGLDASYRAGYAAAQGEASRLLDRWMEYDNPLSEDWCGP